MPIDVTPANPNDDAAVCGGNGDPRKPGDGVLNFNQDNNTVADGSVPFNDKEYIAAGPRPSGVSPQCFAPITKRVRTCASNAVGVDRVYVTWSLFNTFASIDTANVNIVLSYLTIGASRGRRRRSSAARRLCLSFPTPAQANRCNLNQFSVPTVHPTTGALYVGFENFNTPDENEYLVTRSLNGGQTFIAPASLPRSTMLTTQQPATARRATATDRTATSAVNAGVMCSPTRASGSTRAGTSSLTSAAASGPTTCTS
ncbi:MAG: hypothetical protein WKH64_06190 [Chloroflexia bacterium]